MTFDSGDENAFRVHIGDMIVTFSDNKDGLYLSKPDKTCFRKLSKENKRNTIEGLDNFKTVGENKKSFSERQFKRALVARKLYHMVGAPTFLNLKMMIRQNIIENLSVTVEDIC